MGDDLKKGPTDPTKVNIHEAWEVEWWVREMACHEEQLIAAIKVVGVQAKDVAKHLCKPCPVA
jgi:Protein of unknown function (DUF3606)